MDPLIPLWGAIVSLAGVMATTVGVVVWVFTTFERKVDADDLAARVDAHQILLVQVAQDVSYIRGRLELK